MSHSKAISTTAVWQCLGMPIAAAISALSIWVFSLHIDREHKGRPASFLQTAAVASRPPNSLIQEESEVQTVRIRSHVQVTRDTLTEGPQRTEDTLGRKGYDSIQVYYPGNTAWSGTHYVVGWKPYVARHTCPNGKEVEFIHHMNLETADFDKSQPLENKAYFEEDYSMLAPWGDVGDKNTFQFGATYDRGAGEYRLPAGYGIPVERLLLEHHLLMPDCWDFRSPALDDSGFDLYVTSTRPTNLARIVGFLGEDIEVDPKQGLVENVFRFTDQSGAEHTFRGHVAKPEHRRMASISRHPVNLVMNPQGHVEILAVHLHTHEITRSKFLEVLDANGQLTFRSDEEPGGYGLKQQSFHNLNDIGWPRLPWKPGETFKMHCKLDTDLVDFTILEGTSHGEEMCGPLFIVGGPGLRLGPTQLGVGILASEIGRALKAIAHDVMDDIYRLLWGSGVGDGRDV